MCLVSKIKVAKQLVRLETWTEQCHKYTIVNGSFIDEYRFIIGCGTNKDLRVH